jgi:hypothetical protein
MLSISTMARSSTVPCTLYSLIYPMWLELSASTLLTAIAVFLEIGSSATKFSLDRWTTVECVYLLFTVTIWTTLKLLEAGMCFTTSSWLCSLLLTSCNKLAPRCSISAGEFLALRLLPEYLTSTRIT